MSCRCFREKYQACRSISHRDVRCQSGGHHTWRHYNHSRFRRSTIHNRRCDTHNHRPQLCRYRIGRGAERRSLDSYIWCESGQRYRDDYHKTGQKGAGRISVSYGLSIDHQPKRIPISDAREYLSITREAATRAYNPDKYPQRIIRHEHQQCYRQLCQLAIHLMESGAERCCGYSPEPDGRPRSTGVWWEA